MNNKYPLSRQRVKGPTEWKAELPICGYGLKDTIVSTVDQKEGSIDTFASTVSQRMNIDE